MSIAENITKQIEVIEPGVIFSYNDFKVAPNTMVATANTLSRLASKGIIKRFEKGKYFKPKLGMYGERPLQLDKILEYILKENGNLKGYITGTTAYNRMGLSTQISTEYVVASYELRKPLTSGLVKIRFVKAYSTEITEKNIFSLQLLDSIKDIQNIPGTGVNDALEIIKIKLKELPLIGQKKLVQLALNYPPATRAIIGAIFELIGNDAASNKLFKTLNPLSNYKLSVATKVLPNKNKWNIK